MANLINALPQQPSNNPSPTENLRDANALAGQFEENLSSALNGDSEDQQEVGAELAAASAAQHALLKNMINPQPVNVANAEQAAAASKANAKVTAGDAAATQKAAIQNNLKLPQNKKAPVINANPVSPQDAILQNKLNPEVTQPKVNNGANTTGEVPKKVKIAPSEFQVNPLKKGQEIEVPAGLGAVEVEELTTGKSDSKKIASDTNSKVGSHSSNLSTDSFLNLREISQAKTQTPGAVNAAQVMPSTQAQVGVTSAAAGLGTKAISGSKDKNDEKLDQRFEQLSAGMQATVHSTPQQHTFAKVMDAPVTQGSQLNSVLTHDTLNQIATHVSNMNGLKQDGEIKLRLKPDHLGELQMSVRTQGQNVSIQIRAQDEKSKKIIEDSLSSLKDNLNAQNLTLGSIEVVTQAQNQNQQQMNMAPQDFSAAMNMDSQSNQAQQRQSDQQNDSAGRAFAQPEVKTNVADLARARSAAQAASQRAGRLDLIA